MNRIELFRRGFVFTFVVPVRSNHDRDLERHGFLGRILQMAGGRPIAVIIGAALEIRQGCRRGLAFTGNRVIVPAAGPVLVCAICGLCAGVIGAGRSAVRRLAVRSIIRPTTGGE